MIVNKVEELEAEISVQLALLLQQDTESIRSIRRQFSKRLEFKLTCPSTMFRALDYKPDS
jgi:hypothetical protein